jgi:hypothetical protein
MGEKPALDHDGEEAADLSGGLQLLDAGGRWQTTSGRRDSSHQHLNAGNGP